jgi:hypothetical protein
MKREAFAGSCTILISSGIPTAAPRSVLNADYTPLSYYPLSLWPWQTAIKAVFLERVDIVAQYAREVHSPTRTMHIPR